LVVAGVIVGRAAVIEKTYLTAYFDNTNGIYVGDNVSILGVPVGKIESIKPQPERAEVRFWINDKYKVPADAKAAILSPQLITARAIQLTPAYTDGPVMHDGSVIPQNRTAVPVEWDELRQQLQKLAESLKPTEPGGVSTLGAFINTAADNLRGQGVNIHDTIVKLSQALSTLGDHSGDIFGTIKNLSVLVAALHDSSGLLGQLNRNLAAISGLLADDPNEVGRAVDDVNTAVTDTNTFIADNRDTLGTTSDKLASITKAVYDSLDDIQQTLHVAPNAYQNFVNIYKPAQASLGVTLNINNFANPISFLCGAIQAASRLGAEQSAKLCVQYLAPIVKNRQYNFLPIGVNPFVSTYARPNEVTYSEDWMRPDFVAPQVAPAAAPPTGETPSGAPSQIPDGAALPAEAPLSTDPAAGLPGMMTPPQAGG
jgi:phospholipid/cholesterol/gamma-HCH transport system substrate-binding protein